MTSRKCLVVSFGGYTGIAFLGILHALQISHAAAGQWHEPAEGKDGRVGVPLDDYGVNDGRGSVEGTSGHHFNV